MNISLISLILTGIVSAAIGILGLTVFLSDKKGITNQSFYIFSLFTIAYIVFNYIAYATTVTSIALYLFRLTIFFAVWHAFWIFRLLYVFPEESVVIPRWYKFGVIPATIVVSCLTLTPLVFKEVGTVAATGQVTRIINGPGIALFAFLVFGFIAGGFVFFIKKILRADDSQRTSSQYMLIGTVTTFVFLIAFNFVLPAFLDNSQFISLGPLFFFPFIILTFFAITRHGFLRVKVISTEILAFLLSVVTLLELVASQDLIEILLRSGIFVLVLIFSMFLIQSVRREVEQREELQRLNKQIEATNAQLEELSRFKSELLSLASHQIKSPLAAIKGFASLIVEGSYGPVEDKTKEALGKIKASADGLIGLINTLLDVRKVEEGKMEYQFEKVDLAELVSQVVTALEPLATAKKLKFDFDFQKSPVFVNADKEKLRQVIQNLTDNSIKYTPAGFVHLSIKQENARAIFSVSDSGVGIPKLLIPHLFEEFVRDERVKKQILGTGLGLYIARKIVESHGGKILAESAGEGKGSTFNVSLATVQ